MCAIGARARPRMNTGYGKLETLSLKTNYGKCLKISIFLTEMHKLSVLTHFTLLLKKQSDRELHCLPFSQLFGEKKNHTNKTIFQCFSES